MRKLYIQPDMELVEIKLLTDVLATSADPEDPLNPNLGTEFDPDAGFEDEDFDFGT